MRLILSTLATLLFLSLFAIVPAAAWDNPNETEPNNTKDQATLIEGLTIRGSMNEGDTNDWFVLAGQEGANPTITLDFDGTKIEIDWEIYSDDAMVANLNHVWGGPEPVKVAITGTCYVHVYLWSGAGDYSITINGGDGGSGNLHPDDHVHLTGNTETEPNNEKDQANLVENLTIRGSMNENDTNDWFVLAGQEGSNPTITLDFDGTKIEIDWQIYSDDTMVANLKDVWGGPEPVKVGITGTCYVHVYLWSGAGDYTITINGGDGDGGNLHPEDHVHLTGLNEIEPNDTPETAITIVGDEINAYSKAGDQDWFRIDGLNGDYNVTVTFNAEVLEVDWDVWSGDSKICYDSTFGSPNVVPCSIHGPILVHVWNWSGEGGYVVKIS